jgi:hypothetical protein
MTDMKQFNYIMISRCGGAGDLLMLEPTIEALYYAHAPCRIILRTYKDYEWVLRDSPFIWKTVLDTYHCEAYGMMQSGKTMSDLNGELSEPVEILHLNMHSVIEALDGMHGVDVWPPVANAKLLRRTPSFGHYNFERHHKTVVQLRECGDGRDLTREMLPMDLLGDAVFIEGTMDNADYLKLIAGADTFIGPDSSGLHIAHAAGVRKIVGLYTKTYPAELRAYPGIRRAENTEQLRWQIEGALAEPLYPDYLNVGNAADAIRGSALLHCRGRGIDVGSSEWPLAGCVAVPTEAERHRIHEGPYDFLFSSHCLEHIEAWQDELKLWEQTVKVGGMCFLYLPHPAMEMWAPGGPWVGPWHKWAPSPVSLVKWLHENTALRVEEYSCYPDSYWSFYLIARRLA